jgi:hypothetical protein
MEVYRTLRRVGEKKCVMALALDDVPDHDCLMFGVVKPSEFSLVGYQGTDVSLDVQGW